MSYKRSFRPRGLVAFVVFGGFVVMTGTGLILFMTPPGRVTHWTDWALLGLEKTDWVAVHIFFSLLFVLVGLIHLVFNWKPFKNYLVNKFAGHLRLRYAGTGLGQKTIAEIAETTGVPLETVLARLRAGGIEAAPGDKMKAVAAAHNDMSPIDLLKAILDAKP